MEEDGRTIVTRLRRRLSVEADDVSSPATPLTPTKKRGGRLAAKPVLDNIDENAPVSSPRTTRRRSTAKDLVEEEKIMTPSKRSARIRSNTSLTLDTTQNIDSPRARRAARRTSQAGSDTEVSVTPVKQTRRTRKDSTSSVENLADAVVKPAKQITEEIIVEEPEALKSSNSSLNETISPNSVRKSRRIAAKKDRNSLNKSDTESNTSVTVTQVKRKSRSKESVDEDNTTNTIFSTSIRKKPRNKFSLSEVANLAEDDIQASKKNPARSRAKSWTNEPIKDESFLGVKESVKTNSNRSFNKSTIKYSEDFTSDDLTHKEHSKGCNDKENIEILLNSSKIKKDNKKKDNSQLTDKLPVEKSMGEDVVDHASQMNNSHGSETSKLLSDMNNEDVNVKIVIEDTNSDKTEKHDAQPKSPSKESNTIVEITDPDDQCVPVISHDLNDGSSEIEEPTKQTKDAAVKSNFGFGIFSALNKSREKKSSVNDSCEPMDIDETLPENDSILNRSKENIESENKELPITIKESKNTRRSKTDSTSENTKFANTSVLQSSKNKDVDKVAEKTISHIKERTRKSKTPSISEDNGNDISFSQSIKNTEKAANISVIQTKERSRKSKSISISENDKKENSLSQSVVGSLEKSFTPKKSRKSSSLSEDKLIGHDLEKSSNENKTTLILSHIKDDSTMEKNETKSPKITKETVSNISNVLEVSNDKVSKKNTSLSQESTDTPLKHKTLQKLGMQTSTPVITSNSHKTGKLESSKNISLASKKSDKYESSSEEEEDSNEEESCNVINDLINDQAEDAGDDYESGDSQDSSEKEYEEQNEIPERGETLSSEDDVSNDTDYEKDSFIVSSDEEDNELMSGTGDDLSMSDNELTMSAKSKKKFNERKVKEQKRASREMFEARHKNKNTIEDSSDDESSKPVRKNNRQRLDSTLLASGDDSTVKTKKNKSRLDSSHNLSAKRSDADDDSIVKPKKNKMRLDSSHETSALQSEADQSKNKSKLADNSGIIEKEISTVVNESIHNDDPLVTAIKKEPKTPQKFDISTVNISVRPDVEEINIGENASMMQTNETSDPLQQTMAFDGEDDDDDSSSGNEEIMQNYDSILKNLNKESEKKFIKTKDTSLNLDKKEKIKPNHIIEQLNLTQTKKDQERKPSVTVSKSNNKVEFTNDDSSSDSLDLKLLFPCDSDNNEDGDGDKNNKVKDIKSNDEDFIPLKKCEAKTNLQENLDKKNKELSESMTAEHVANESVLKTPGSNKKKNKTLSESSTVNENDVVARHSDKKKNKRLSESSVFTETEQAGAQEQEKSYLLTPGTHNHNKKIKKPCITLNEGELDLVEIFMAPNSAKKTKRTSESSGATELVDVLNVSANKSAQKKTKKLSVSLTSDQIESENNVQDSTSGSSKKKKRKVSQSLVTDSTETVIQGTELEEMTPKKRKRKSSIADEIVLKDPVMLQDLLLAAGDGSQTKKIKFSKTDEIEDEELNNENVEKSKKKNKKSGAVSVQADIKVTEVNQDVIVKKKKNLAVHENIQNIPDNLKPKSKKRKERDDDNSYKQSKVRKENYFDNLRISRLPSTILEQLDEKPKSKTIVSTSAFAVEEIVKRKTKPSQFLEESIYLNFDSPEKKKNQVMKIKPKVLPFVPTASTSGSGFTTNFQVNVLAKETKFVAQASNIPNFKSNYINEKIKKMGTYEMYRKQRNVKLSKF